MIWPISSPETSPTPLLAATSYQGVWPPPMLLPPTTVWHWFSSSLEPSSIDGMTARLLHVSSPIGKELDSLADVVTFGVAPSTMIFTLLHTLSYPVSLEPLRHIIPYFAYVMAAFSALRLAKFNIDERQHSSFIGLPTPANALFWASLIVGAETFIINLPHAWALILLLVCVSCWLLVSGIHMFALKFKQWGWHTNQVKYIFVLTCIPMLAIFGVTGIAIIIAWYIILSAFSSKLPTE